MHFQHFPFPQDGKNIGHASILKMVDQADLGQYVTYPTDIVKFKKGQTPDPGDDNALWNITYDPTNPQIPWWDGIRSFDATYSYNQDKCVWTNQCQKCSMNTNQCVLKDLYDATDGDSWDNNTGWDFTEVSDPCSSNPSNWFGITCDGGDITEIILGELNSSVTYAYVAYGRTISHSLPYFIWITHILGVFTFFFCM